jgi:enoyl-CoA hydratase
MYQNVTLEIKEGIAVLTINRPKQLNALNGETLVELGQAVAEIEQNKDIDVVIVTGAGEKSFVAGADIAEMKDKTPVEGRDWGKLGNEVFYRLENLPQPTIAAVNGFALGGGCELAMACDIRIASEKAKFGQPEVGLGITPGFGGTQRLPRLVGKGKAKELIFTGDIIKADEAAKIGLVNKVVPAEELMSAAMEMAKKIQSKAKVAVQQSKLAINRGMEADLVTGIGYEAQAFAVCFATEDQKEAMDAFVNKREAKLKGK